MFSNLLPRLKIFNRRHNENATRAFVFSDLQAFNMAKVHNNSYYFVVSEIRVNLTVITFKYKNII